MALIRAASAALLASGAAATTGILLPLYVYPSAEFGDGAANWRPAVDAMAASAHVPWLAVVNPGNGPGPTGEPGNGDANYIAGVSQLNALANVRPVGYVRTDYGASPAAELYANITTWAGWAAYGGAEDVGVDGIFFDEASAADLEYLRGAAAHARAAFGSKQIVTVCNFGAAAPAEAYAAGVCDVVVVFESFLNDPAAPPYLGRATIDANTPDGGDYGAEADVALLGSYVREAADAGLGWLYFCSADYDSITAAPATIGALAAAF
ncbi:putative cell surface spherulin 4-like protein [Rosellinia necatrix]|uniref:Putative cell surface spherulin 4-like protein n=1 Tax=Rosellinia necatrix TaxID=77044 RepID=A0A1W2TX76_ROSNE|nr:putative cell surface spherulin 4-like protein [Rosellinia necatrix]